ncbi:RAM signaling pathway protein-domain-containing protein [Podospora aff. communis PSN243]|uniref:RAM signaling pathway protein-domain-containing protein n=1 Tax=Podospora aff. communis PSN243 TaxID=3040156 RepID=A0AAV9H1K7_9PEZI|nr:RAM signaling pathway protein-domain-containing protein [Podospora aff. communis PSN243]
MERKAPQSLLQSQQQQAPPLMKNGIPRRLVPPPQPRPGPATGPGPTATGLPTPGPPGVTTAAATAPANATPLSPGQVTALVRDARKKALGDDDSRTPADAPVGADGLKPGITLDLIGKNIPALPDEVVDILRNGVERLALSHNSLASLPTRFSLCTSLRYFAARNNTFETFPLPLCDLTSLEFLDLGRNRLKELPPEISKLTSLKAFAVIDNQIERLPLGMADMTSLQRLRLTGNPIKFPPKEVLRVQPGDVPANEILSKNEVVELLVTDQIKKFLAQRQTGQTTEGISETEGGDDESSEGADTPRITTRRATGRFPIRVKGSSEAAPSPPVSRSPSLSRPPIPGRSHFRGLSQFSNASTRKPGIIPLTMGKSTESLRSNGEPLSSLDDLRPESRSSRRGLAAGGEVPQQNSLAVNEPKMNRFSSHLRGFSYSGGLTLTNPFSPEDPSLQRPLYVRELPALPVRKYESRAVDPVLEVARGILYSIFQIHLGVQTLMSLTNDGSARRSSLEMVFYNTNVYFEELEQAIQDYDLASGTRGMAREHEGMQRAYTTLIQAYVHICSRLISSVDLLVDNGDQRYMRTFLMLVYHSIMELRVAINGWISSKQAIGVGPPADSDNVPIIPPKSRSRAASAVREPSRPAQAPANDTKKRAAPPKQVRTDLPYPPGASGRAATAIAVTGTLRPDSSSSSGDSFTSAVSSVPSARGRPGQPLANPTSSSSPPPPRQPPSATITKLPPTSTTTSSDNTSETHFERFYLSLKTATELIQCLVPSLTALFTSGLRRVRLAPASPSLTELEAKWSLLLTKSETVLKTNNLVRERLSTLRLRDPNLTRYSPFWDLCRDLFGAWFELGDQIRLALVERVMPLPSEEIVEGLKRISRSTKESMNLMVVARRQGVSGSGGSGGRGVGSRSGSLARFGNGEPQKGGWVEAVGPLPMTPQSAALGPAARATRGFSGEP